MSVKPKLLLLIAAVAACGGQRPCTRDQQTNDRVSKDIIRDPLPEATQTSYKFAAKLHLGPMDQYPYTHKIFDVACGDEALSTSSSNDAVFSTFTNTCAYSSGIGAVSGFEDAGCDTWVELAWADQHAGANNYSVVSFNAAGVPLWVVHSVASAQEAMDLTNCFATNEIACGTRHPRHKCKWFPLDPTKVGSNGAHGRCIGNAKNKGYLDQNYHGPTDLNAQLPPQGNVATSPSADLYYAGLHKEHHSYGLQAKGKDRITIVLFKNDVPDHPPVPWLPDPANLHLSFKSQFLKPVGLRWYWVHGLDRAGAVYSPHACTIVPNKAYWNEEVELSFHCTECRAVVDVATGATPLASSDALPSRAWDGDAATGYAAWDPSGGYTRAKLERPVAVSALHFRAVAGKEADMVLGRFYGLPPQGGGPEVLLAVIETAPAASPEWTRVAVLDSVPTDAVFQYVTYHGTARSHSRVADIEVYYKCGGGHASEGDVLKAVPEGEGCPPKGGGVGGAGAYGTPPYIRTELQCLWRDSDECFGYSEVCRWDAAEQECRQRVPSAKAKMTFVGTGAPKKVRFCYEGELMPRWATLVVATKVTVSPFATPLPVGSGTGNQPPPTTVQTPAPPLSGRFTPYPAGTATPADTPLPPGVVTSVPLTAAPTQPDATTPSPATAVPAMVPPPPPPVPAPPALQAGDLGLALYTSYEGGAAGAAADDKRVYSYLSDGSGAWTCTAGVPCRTVIFTPADARALVQKRVPGAAVGGGGVPPRFDVACRLVSEQGQYAEAPFGTHSFPSSLAGSVQAVGGGDKAVFLDLSITTQSARKSTFLVACALRAVVDAPSGATPTTAQVLLEGEPHTARILLLPLIGGSNVDVDGAGEVRRIVKMRIAVQPADASAAALRALIAEALGLPADTPLQVVVRPASAAAAAPARAAAAAQQQQCADDPSVTRSTEVWVRFTGPPRGAAAGAPKTEGQATRALLGLLTSATSPLPARLCGVLEAYAEVPEAADLAVMQAAAGGSGGSSPAPEQDKTPDPGVGGPPTAGGGGGGGGGGSSSGSDNDTVLFVVVLTLCVVLCLVGCGAWWLFHRRPEEKEEEGGRRQEKEAAGGGEDSEAGPSTFDAAAKAAAVATPPPSQQGYNGYGGGGGGGAVVGGVEYEQVESPQFSQNPLLTSFPVSPMRGGSKGRVVDVR